MSITQQIFCDHEFEEAKKYRILKCKKCGKTIKELIK